MHRLEALVLAALTLPASGHAQWAWGNSGTTSELRGLSVVDATTAWASGARGTVLRTADGGRSWRLMRDTALAHLDLRALHAFDGARALVASAGEAEQGLAAIFRIGEAALFERTFDSRQKGVFLDAVAFWDDRHGIALSDPVDSVFVVLLTDDGGRSWSRIPAAALPRVLPGEAAFAASGSSVAVQGGSHVWIGTGGGGRARVMHSADRGRSWSVAEVPVHADGPAAGIFSLSFFDARHGVAAGGDYTKPRLAAPSVALTSDGGRTWRPAPASPPAYLSGIAYAGSRARLVAVGLAGTFVSADSGRTWTHTDTVALNAVRFAGSTGFAAGPRGRVARWMR